MVELERLFDELERQSWGRPEDGGEPLPRERILSVADELVRGGL
jgi:hypothetical protein